MKILVALALVVVLTCSKIIQIACLFLNEGSHDLQTLKDVERFYVTALQEPLNLTKLAQITDYLYQHKYSQDRGRPLQKRTFSVADSLDPELISSIYQQQQIPLMHHFLNVFLLHQKNPQEKKLLMKIIHQSIEMGLDITVPFKDDPPVYYKALFIKEFALTRHMINHNPKIFLADIIARSHKLHKFLKMLYSLTPEIIPMTKLVLHIQKIMEVIYEDFRSSQLQTAPTSSTETVFNGTAVLHHLLESARLDKPTVKPFELWQASQTYDLIVRRIAQPQYSNQTTLNVLKLSSIQDSLNDLVYSIFQALVSSFQFSERKYVAVEHLLEIHLLIDEQRRNLFHFLTMSNSILILRELIGLWEAYYHHATTASSVSPSSSQQEIEIGLEGIVIDDKEHGIKAEVEVEESEELQELRKRILRGLTSKDHRGHTPLSYAVMRYGTDSQIAFMFRDFLELFQSKDDIDHIYIPSPTDSIAAESSEGLSEAGSGQPSSDAIDKPPLQNVTTDLGGWDELRIIDEKDQGKERCDVLEVWDEALPDAETFFRKYINTATPVIFRGAALLPEEEMSKLRKIFSKEVFLRKYGKLKVSTSPIPYGESFGVQPITTSLKEIALHRHDNISANTTITLSEAFSLFKTIDNRPVKKNGKTKDDKPHVPNYVFVTPPAQWGSRFTNDVPIPKPLILPISVDPPAAFIQPSLNLSAIASNTQKHGKQTSYSFELQFYLGSAGTGAPVHFHGHAINTLAYGEKKWLLYPVERALYSTMTGLEFHAVLQGNISKEVLENHQGWSEAKREALVSATGHYLQCTQHAGDILYVPPLYGHSTLNSMQSIGVAHEFSVESFCME